MQFPKIIKLIKFSGDNMYNILLVDDDRIVRNNLRRNNLWNKNGFEICGEAVDGYEALKKVSSCHFDMAFVDIEMPRIDGIQFLRKLREDGEKMCVVFMSEHSDFAYARQGIVLGAFDYMLKPVDKSNLSDVLSRAKILLDKKRKEEITHSKLSKLVNENLNMYGFSDEVNELYMLIASSPDNAAPFAEQIVKKITDFCKNDTDEIEILLKHVRESLCTTIIKLEPWLADLNMFDTGSKINISSCSAGSSFISFINYLVSIFKKLHLNDGNSIVRQLCKYVLQHCDEKISLRSASMDLGFNSSYLGRLFKQKTGESFVEYVTKVKIERAKALLLTGKYKSYEISEMLGYGKVDYFRSLFKEYTGETPMAYKHSIHSGYLFK